MDYLSLPHYWINHVGFQIRKELEAAFTANGHHVTAEEWSLLLILNADDALSPSELSRMTLRDVTTVSRLIDRLEKKGLVERKRGSKDRRIVYVHKTHAGQKIFAEIEAIAHGIIAKSLRGVLPEDVETAIKLMKKIAENLSATERETHV